MFQVGPMKSRGALYEGGRRGGVRRRCEDGIRARGLRGIRRWYPAGFAEGGRSHKPSKAGGLSQLEKARGALSSRASRKIQPWFSPVRLIMAF